MCNDKAAWKEIEYEGEKTKHFVDLPLGISDA